MTAARLVAGIDQRMLIVCDHAANAVPPGIDLGLPAGVLAEHVAWDIGAADVAESLATSLCAPAWLAGWSRLVVDCNRPPDAAIAETSDGKAITGNIGLGPDARGARLAIHTAFHDGLAGLVATWQPKLLVSLHSFTPALASDPAPRPWPVGILWNQDDRAARLGLQLLGAEAGLGGPVGANQPYSGRQLNYTMDRHAEARGIAYLGFEIRQDLIGDTAGVARWSAIVARTVIATLAGLAA